MELMVLCVGVVLLNACVSAMGMLWRASRFGRGNIFGVSVADMQLYRNGLREGYFLPRDREVLPGRRLAVFLRRWLWVFPGFLAGRFFSGRFWLWCVPQIVLAGILWRIWPEIVR